MALFSLVTVVFVSTPLVLFGPSTVAPSSTDSPSVAPGAVAPAAVAQLAWIQWTAPAIYPESATINSGGTFNYTYATQAVGTIAIPGGSTVYVKFTGEIVNYPGASGFNIASNSFWSTSDGVGIDGAAFRSANVPDLPTNGDRIAVSGSTTGGVQLQTLEFFSDAARTTPVNMANLVMDVWSLGAPYDEGIWNFTQNFDILSDNKSPVSSYSGLTKDAGGPPYALTGFEGTGTIQFTGSYSSVAWTVVNPEFYAVWNIGVTTATAPSDSGITPSTSSITGEVGTAITPVTFTDKEFVGAVTYAVKSGTLPADLSLNPATGEITGTPTGAVTTTVVIEATGATSGKATASLDFAITAPTYVVTFDSSGGSTVPDGSYTAGGGVTFPAAPTRDGFTFLGWFAAASGGTALTDGYLPSGTGPITLYAQWAAVPVTTTTSSTSTSTSTTSATVAVAPSGPSRSTLPFTGAQILTFSLLGMLLFAAGLVFYSVGYAGSPAGARLLSSASRSMAAAAVLVRERTRRPERTRPQWKFAGRPQGAEPVIVRPAPKSVPKSQLRQQPQPTLAPTPKPAVVIIRRPAPEPVPEPVVEPVLEPVVEFVAAPEIVEPVIESPLPAAWARAQAVASAQLAEEWAMADRVAAAARIRALRSRRRRLEGAAGEQASSWRARIEAQLLELDVPLD